MLRAYRFPREREEVRKLGEGHVNLRRGSVRPEPLDCARKLRLEAVAADEPEERSLRIRVREDGPRPQFLPAPEADADGPPVLDDDPLNVRVHTDFHTKVSGRRRERLRDRPHPALHEAPHVSGPSMTPSMWWANTYAEPASLGPTIVPITAF